MLISSITGSNNSYFEKSTKNIESITRKTLDGVFPSTAAENKIDELFPKVSTRRINITTSFSLTTIESQTNRPYEYKKLVEQNTMLMKIILVMSVLILCVVLGKMQIN